MKKLFLLGILLISTQTVFAKNQCEVEYKKGFWETIGNAHNKHKELDNNLILGDNQGCIIGYDEILAEKGVQAPIYDQNCITVNRQSKERERRDGTDGIVNGLNGILGAFAIIKAL